MIKFFRKIRQQLLIDDKTSKYFKYAIGEIILVVIGILIALQVNNWNQDRIQKIELNELLKSIAGNVESDIESLKLLKIARENIHKQSDSVANYYKMDQQGLPIYEIRPMNRNEAIYFADAFSELTNTVLHQPNLNAFEALKNSAYFGKLQGADIGKVLSAYYTFTNNLNIEEVEHNQNIKNQYQEWLTKVASKSGYLFQNPFLFDESSFQDMYADYQKIANDGRTLGLFYGGVLGEESLIKLYDDLIVIGEMYTEMVKNDKMYFTNNSKIEFDNISPAFSNEDILNVLINGKLRTGFNFAASASGFYGGWRNFEEDHIALNYPDNQLDWGFPYIIVGALNGRVNQKDFSKYKKLVIEMKGVKGGETIAIVMKDKLDLHDGSESRLQLTLTDEWKMYEFDIDQFETADKTIIQIPFGIVLEGSEGRQVQLKTVRFE